MNNLQKFIKCLKEDNFGDLDKLGEFLVENINNEDFEKFEYDGEEYILMDSGDVQDQLDEDFETEISDFLESARGTLYGMQNLRIIDSLKSINILEDLTSYKSLTNDFDNLNDFDFASNDFDNDIFIYTSKY